MCGIIGILGRADVAGRVIEGLSRLEYRGYDSAGIALLDQHGRFHIRRAVGKLGTLRQLMNETPASGIAGIGHTRWATHGAATLENAHPHYSKNIAIVHNGIIENYLELKQELLAEGVNFKSDTDTEVIVHLFERLLLQSLSAQEAFFRLLDLLEGSYALVALLNGRQDELFVARHGSPLVIGYGPPNEDESTEMFVGSDALALSPLTNQISYLEDGDRAVVTRERVLIVNVQGREVVREIVTIAETDSSLSKGSFQHFMLKEISEQPRTLSGLLGNLANGKTGELNNFLPDLDFSNVGNVSLIACGTAHYACHVAQYWFESLSGLDAKIDIASEYRYRDKTHRLGELVIAVSQSGETADTLAALKDVGNKKIARLALVNVVTSSLAREAEYVLDIKAGPEVGVASTKAFTGQLLALLMIAIKAGVYNGKIALSEASVMIKQAAKIPSMVEAVLALEPEIRAIAEQIAGSRDVIFLGRGVNFPVALEAALKLKELTYIHAEGYAAGELKHGPIALIDTAMPVVVFANAGQLQRKTLANAEEVASRGAKVWLVGYEDGSDLRLPPLDELTAPFAYAVVAQLLAYHTALAKGTDVDRPRNLAKSVTVE